MPRFCTAINQGQSCSFRARPGQKFCAGHLLGPDSYGRCAWFNRRGEPCRSIAIRAHDYCFTHSPRNHRLQEPPVPLVPRTRRQRALAKPIVFSNLPQSRRALEQASWNQ